MPYNDQTFLEENTHLKGVVEKVKRAIVSLEKGLTVLGSSTLAKLKEFREGREGGMDAFVFLEELQEKYEAFNVKDKIKRITELNYLSAEPYFARIDLKEKENPDQTLYLGKFGYTEKEPVIIDWRAKIASVYYRYRYPQKNVEYETPMGKEVRDLKLKRTFEINNGELLKYYNNDIQLDENEILVEKIKARTGGVLEDIVATIQESQLDIIESDPRQVCIVQGCVGSGKSTVAIHKLSHIFFNFPKLIHPEKSILITKNQILAGYLSTLFPKLGVFDINYATLKDLLIRIIFREELGIKIDFDSAQNPEGTDIAFVNELRALVESLHEEAKNRLAQIFDKEEFKSFGGIVYDKKIPVLQNFQETIEEMEEEIENHTGYLESTYVNPARKELYKENLKTLKKIIALLRSEKAGIKNSLFNKLLGGLGISKGGKLTYAETLVYVYLHSKISGIKKLEKYEYCVVDEGQDLSAMEYLFLNELVLYGRMCVFGDLNQGFAENGVQDWGTVVEVVDGAKNASKFELDTNYRSTKQIIDFATDILAPYTKTYLPKSINRMGEQPRIIGSVSLPAVLSKEVVIENGRPKKSVGIICFNRDLIELARVAIESIGISKDSLVLLDAKKRITYLPNGVYLTHFDDCKGLEFNKVIVLGFDLGQVKTFADAKKAFVAVTRAMNELVVIS